MHKFIIWVAIILAFGLLNLYCCNCLYDCFFNLQELQRVKRNRFGLGSLKLDGSSHAFSSTSSPALMKKLQAAKTEISKMDKTQLEQAKAHAEHVKELAYFKRMFLQQFPYSDLQTDDDKLITVICNYVCFYLCNLVLYGFGYKSLYVFRDFLFGY